MGLVISRLEERLHERERPQGGDKCHVFVVVFFLSFERWEGPHLKY